MKKSLQLAGAKRQIALHKMERRNYQKNANKHASVHAAPESHKEGRMQEPASIALSVKEPKRVKRTTKKSGMISLRVERTTARLLRSMKECPGASFETHADACKMGLSTFYRWMDDGEKDPNSIYGRFRQEMLQAMAEGEKVLHNMAARSTPIHVLTRRFPNHYPSDKVRVDMTSGDLPIQAGGNFTVLLELHPAEGAARQEDKPFTIVEPSGEKWEWSSSEDHRLRRLLRNGDGATEQPG